MTRVAIIVSAFILASASLQASVAEVETNFVRYYTGANATAAANPRLAISVDAASTQVRQLTAAGYLRADGTWTDINYSETPSGSWSPWDHVRRLKLMAQTYQTPGHRLYRDATLRAQIESAIGAVETFYGPARLPLGNWWFWTLGIPLDLGPTLVLMRNDVSPSVIDRATRTLAFRIGPNPSSSPVGPTLVGQNLIWGALNHLALAILTSDDAMMQRVRDAVASVCTYAPAGVEGVKPDHSFHQHGAQLYTGGYGGSFANDVARYILLTSETSHAIDATSSGVFASFLVDGIAWAMRGNYFDVSVISREVAKPSTTGYNGVAALLQAAHASTPRKPEIAAAAANALLTWQWTLPIELAALTTNIGASPAAQAGFRHYFNSDYSIARRPAWFASVKMLSTRTKSGEKTNNENLLGSRQSDGRFFLTLNGREHQEPNVWPSFDWTRLPGTTVEQKPDAASAIYGFGTRSFVGGTGNGNSGVAAMDFAAINSTLTARKAYFFLDDAVVFLSNGISATSTYPVETIVQQWPLSALEAPITADGSNVLSAPGAIALRPRWLHTDGIGYFFGGGANVRLSRSSRSGSWSSINGGASSEKTDALPFVTVLLDHGASPRDAEAAYAVVPNITVTQMREWSTIPPFIILRNDATVSSVRDTRAGMTGFVFWQAGSLDGISVDRPALVHRRATFNRMTLSIADPTNASGMLRVTVTGNYTLVDPAGDVTMTRGLRTTTIDLPLTEGRTTTVTLQQSVRRRPLRRS